MRKFYTLFAAVLMSTGMWAQSITVSIDTESNFQPTTISNGSFDDEPWMVFTFENETYQSCPHDRNLDTASDSKDNESGYAQNVVFNGVGGGWNTTERTLWRSSLFEITNSTDGKHNYQHNSSIPQTDKYVEMNNYHSCMLYQDLRTNSHDVIRWTLKHAVTTAGNEYQPIRVEIGAPNRDSNGNIVNASGWANSLDPQIVLSTKAIYRHDGVTDKDGKTSKIGFGSATDLQYLRLHNTDGDQRSGWWTAQGVYAIPEGQTVTRFGFISEAEKKNQGNLLDAITFSTLIGNLSAQQLVNHDVEVKGYWGETDPIKRFKVVIDGVVHDIDMSSVVGKNFRIIIPASIVGTATSVEAYHQDYQVAENTIAVTPVYSSTLQSGTDDASQWSISPAVAEANTTIDVTYSGLLRPATVATTPIASTWTMEYTGTIQSFTAPATGVYELQVWGAQGGTYSDYNAGGLGGYATCHANLTQGETIYIYVGGQGGTGTNAGAGTGGWNGGGTGGKSYSSYYPSAGGGGGATHISKVNNQVIGSGSGQCASLVGSNFIIVAGGGGGAGWAKTTPGVGGGTEASKGTKIVSSDNYSTYSTYYYYSTARSYGANGGNSVQVSNCDAEGAGGGGGGYYGGNAYCANSNFPDKTTFQNAAGCGGGSACNSSHATDYSATAGLRSGNGKAEIRLLSVTGAPSLTEATKVADNHWQYTVPNYNVEVQVEYHPFPGTGTENDPYLISSSEDWNLLASKVNGGKTYAGKYFRQTADFTVTNVVGATEHADGGNLADERFITFNGIYDGDGHILNVNIDVVGERYVGPFHCVSDATIRNLVVTGYVSITGGSKVEARRHPSALIGCCREGNVLIENCHVSANVSGADYIGGLIGHSWDANVTIRGCVYSGTLTAEGHNCTGGFIGWGGDHGNVTIVLTNNLFVGSYSGSGRFQPMGFLCSVDNNARTVTNSYYKTTATIVANNDGNNIEKDLSNRSKLAYRALGGEGVTLEPAGSLTTYNVSGISTNNLGLKYNDAIYAAGGETISLDLSGSSNYKASAGTLTGSSNPRTLSMPASNVTIYGAASVSAAPSANNLTYTGTEQALVSAGTAVGGTMAYSLDNNVWSTTVPTATNAGNYTVFYRVEGDDTHADYTPEYNSVAVSIDKINVAITTPPAIVSGLVYNGQLQTLITAGTSSHGEIEYRLNDGTYSTAIPQAEAIGVYTVYYRVAMNNANYVDVPEASLIVSISATSTLYDNDENLTVALTGLANSGAAYDITIGRTIYAGPYNTFCLPFDLSAEQIAASPLNGAILKDYNGADVTGTGAERDLNIHLTDLTQIEAGKPFLVKTETNIENPVFNDVTITYTGDANGLGQNIVADYVDFQGLLAPFDLAGTYQSSPDYLGVGMDGRLYWADATLSTAKMRAFRAFFHVKEVNIQNSPVRRGMHAQFVEDAPQTPTDVEPVTGNPSPVTEKILRNGILYILRNGKTYNAQGQELE